MNSKPAVVDPSHAVRDSLCNSLAPVAHASYRTAPGAEGAPWHLHNIIMAVAYGQCAFLGAFRCEPVPNTAHCAFRESLVNLSKLARVIVIISPTLSSSTRAGDTKFLGLRQLQSCPVTTTELLA